MDKLKRHIFVFLCFIACIAAIGFRCEQQQTKLRFGPRSDSFDNSMVFKSSMYILCEKSPIRTRKLNKVALDISTKQSIMLFNTNDRNSPRQNIFSFLQFIAALAMYGICLFLNYKEQNTKILRKGCRKMYSIFTKLTPCVSDNLDKFSFSKEDLLSFIFNWTFNNMSPIREISVYLLPQELKRLSTYRCLSASRSPVSHLILSECGFFHTKDEIVECNGCGKRLHLLDFTSHPSESLFHASPNCPFARSNSEECRHQDADLRQIAEASSTSVTKNSLSLDTNQEGSKPGQINTPSEEDQCDLLTTSIQKSSLPLQDEASCQRSPQAMGKSIGELSEDKYPHAVENAKDFKKYDMARRDDSDHCHFNTTQEKNIPSSADNDMSAEMPDEAECLVAYGGELLQNAAQESESGTKSTQNSTVESHGNVSESGAQSTQNSTLESHGNDWTDGNNFAPQCHLLESKSLPEAALNARYDKTDIPETFFPTHSLTLSHLPEYLRTNEIYSFILLVANLTVKIRINQTSDARPKNDLYRLRKPEARFGSGFAFLETEDKADELVKEVRNDSSTSKVRKMKKFLSRHSKSYSKSTYYYFSVRTNKHVVFDDFEASHSRIVLEISECRSGQPRTYKSKGVRVSHCDVEGIYSTVLVCRTKNHELFQWLQDERKGLKLFRQRLSLDSMEKLQEKCFIISHPHGEGKMATFGDCTTVKYTLHDQGRPAERQLQKYIDHRRGATLSDIRESLMYTADTCNGSSGAPVFTSRKLRRNPGEDEQLQLTVWIHNGVENDSGLSCSIMESFWPELTETSKPLAEMAPRLISHKNSSTSKSQLSTNSPGTPLSPSGSMGMRYLTMKSRLETFKYNYHSKCRHSPLELAAAGFYFAGYDDCIKCFSCALGLKGWKPEYDVHQLHKHHRPDCHFLKAHADSTGSVDPIMLFDESKEDDALQVTLLKCERRKLKEKLLCRVCWKYIASEIFLGCGDVFACERCSSFIYSCPVCGKEILATVTVYLC